jgi:hypothetical protein
MQCALLNSGQPMIQGTAVEKKSQQQGNIGPNGQHGKDRNKVTERTENQHGQPMEKNHRPRMELERKSLWRLITANR